MIMQATSLKKSNIAPLTCAERDETLSFLARRPEHTVFMTGLL